MISIIAAVGRNYVIGKDNKIPWYIPADFAYFKSKTMGHTIIMGRKTYQSIGKPLPGRKNVIITKDNEFKAEGCEICHSIEETLKYKEQEEIFIIGGANIYKEFFNLADKLYITLIDKDFEGDTYFPTIDNEVWNLVSKTKGIKDEKNPYDYYFCEYVRK